VSTHTTQCPNCRRENPTGAEFCANCGFSLEWGSEGEARPEDTMQTQVAPAATEPSQESVPPTTAEPPERKPTPRVAGYALRAGQWKWVAAGVACVGLIGAIWIVAAGGGGGGSSPPPFDGGGGGAGSGSSFSGTVVWTQVSVRPGPNEGAPIGAGLHHGEAVTVTCRKTLSGGNSVYKLEEPPQYANDWVWGKAVVIPGNPAEC
jgi:hypothetical protein